MRVGDSLGGVKEGNIEWFVWGEGRRGDVGYLGGRGGYVRGWGGTCVCVCGWGVRGGW